MTKKAYKVKTRFVFEGDFEVSADSKQQAKEYIEKHCGLVIGRSIHTSLSKEIIPDWNFSLHGDKQIIAITKA
jgi:hypothetical protein